MAWRIRDAKQLVGSHQADDAFGEATRKVVCLELHWQLKLFQARQGRGSSFGVLLRLRAQEASVLGDALNLAVDVPGLAAAWARLPRAAAALIAEGVSGREIAAVISRELGALTRYACVLAEQRMKADGFGEAPCAYALCVLGSAGRGESLLAMDQDNALVFADGAPEGAADRWFARLGGILADILHEVGVPYCKGGVMARNPQWRGSMATWHERIADWMDKQTTLVRLVVRTPAGAVVGYGSLWDEPSQPGRSAYVDLLNVHPEHQGRSLARLALAARAAAAASSDASSSPESVSRYRCRGGRPTGTSLSQVVSNSPRSASRMRMGYMEPALRSVSWHSS